MEPSENKTQALKILKNEIDGFDYCKNNTITEKKSYENKMQTLKKYTMMR